MAGHPRPTLIGVIRLAVGCSETERREARLALALRANDEGYALVETFEVYDDPGRDESVYQVIGELAERIDVHYFLTSGDVDEVRLEEIAVVVRVTILAL